MRRTLLQDTDNADRWLVSYADFITLLFGFFVVMYAISSVNEGKYRILSTTLEQAFEAKSRPLDSLQVGEAVVASSPHIIDVPGTTGYRDETLGDTHIEPSAAEITEKLSGYTDGENIAVQENNDWLEIGLNAQYLFSPGTASLSADSQLALSSIAEYLQGFEFPITVEGYSDNVPVEGRVGRFVSNWELSGARASSVAQFLQSTGIDRVRISAVGYGDNHSIATNATPEGRVQNRRVVIVVARKGNLPRNLNTGGVQSAFAFVRHEAAGVLPKDIRQRRTESGGLLFSTDPTNAVDQ